MIRALLDNPSGPSILDQTPWPCGFYKFPDEGESFYSYVEYFNCAAVQRKSGLSLITRRRHIPCNLPGRNTIWTWHLGGFDGNTPLKGRPVLIRQIYTGEHWEDPRAWVNGDGSVMLSWCNFTSRRMMAHQCYGELNEGNSIGRPIHLVYGDNGPHVMANTGHEKNWAWFHHADGLHCSYMPSPRHIVLHVQGNAVANEYVSDSSKAQAKWKWGLLRGGTSPVCIGGHYLAFIHSRLPWRFYNARWFNRYYMGAILFESKPPFRITHITDKILEGSNDDPRNEGAPLTVFPQGLIHQGDSWLVTLGVNDVKCAWIRIPHEDLMRKMVNI